MSSPNHAVLHCRNYPDPVLLNPTRPVETFDRSLSDTAHAMYALMYELDGVGLAANQVGLTRSFFVYDIGNGPATIVNPSVHAVNTAVATSDYEGCLSVPLPGWHIARPSVVVLTGYDLDARPLKIEAHGLLARVFLHETDHLAGHLLLDRLTTHERRAAKIDLAR